MTEGQKSRTARALACVLAALLSVAAFSPALAGAQGGAEEEYELDPNIPNPDETEQSSSGGGDGQNGADAGAAVGSTGSGTPGDSGGASGENKGDRPHGGGGERDRGRGQGQGQGQGGPTEVAMAADQVPSVETGSSDDGGAPVLLIVLALVAAACTGVALWRIRREPPDTGLTRGAESTGAAASESRSV
jgi:cobalamin biosynthesis Mg chelatase CobN